MQLNVNPTVQTQHNSLAMHMVSAAPGLEMDGADPSVPGCTVADKGWTLDLGASSAHADPDSLIASRPGEAAMRELRARARRHIESLEHRTPLAAPALAAHLATTTQLAETILAELERDLVSRWKPELFARTVLGRERENWTDTQASDTQASSNEDEGFEGSQAGSSQSSDGGGSATPRQLAALTPTGAQRAPSTTPTTGCVPPGSMRPPATPFGSAIAKKRRGGRAGSENDSPNKELRTPSRPLGGSLAPKWRPGMRKVSQTIGAVGSK